MLKVLGIALFLPCSLGKMLQVPFLMIRLISEMLENWRKGFLTFVQYVYVQGLSMAWFICNATHAWLSNAGDWSDTGSVNNWPLSLNVLFCARRISFVMELEAMSDSSFGRTLYILFLSSNSVLEFIEMIQRSWFILSLVARECVWPPHFYKLLCLLTLMIGTFERMPYNWNLNTRV